MKPEEILKYCRTKASSSIDLKFNDLPGLWQHFSITLSEMTDDFWKGGIGFDGSSIRGFQAIHESDMLLMPDPATAIIDPVCEIPP